MRIPQAQACVFLYFIITKNPKINKPLGDAVLDGTLARPISSLAQILGSLPSAKGIERSISRREFRPREIPLEIFMVGA